MRTFLRYLSIVVMLVIIFGATLLFTPVGERPLTSLFAVGNIKAVDFAELNLPKETNWFLTCPPGFCGTSPHADSPVFDAPVERLRARWREVIVTQPRVELLAEHRDGWQFDFIQRSARFRFPDIITVRFISASPSRSTLAIYSRSIYGQSDFGVNRKRIEAWLTILHGDL